MITPMTADNVGEAVPAPPARPRRAWNADRVLSLSAMAVGVCSLFITLYQTYLTRQAQSASVLPYLAFGITSTNEGAYLTLRNDGVGPGRLDAVRVHYKGRTTAVDPFDFFLTSRSGPKPPGLSVDRVTPGRLLPANSTILMLGCSGEGDRLAVLREMVKLFALADVPPSWLDELQAHGGDKAVIEIDYSSVYGDRWRIRSDRFVPQPF
jgi:hypothetical protein